MLVLRHETTYMQKGKALAFPFCYKKQKNDDNITKSISTNFSVRIKHLMIF